MDDYRLGLASLGHDLAIGFGLQFHCGRSRLSLRSRIRDRKRVFIGSDNQNFGLRRKVDGRRVRSRRGTLDADLKEARRATDLDNDVPFSLKLRCRYRLAWADECSAQEAKCYG